MLNTRGNEAPPQNWRYVRKADMVTKPRFEKLLEPGRIGKMSLKNRIAMPPMGTHYATDGFFDRGDDTCY